VTGKVEGLPPAVCLMGPTGAGKTAAAVKLIERFPFEIISVDSAMVYRGMDIGTAKPDPDLLARAPHRLIDLRDPDQRYSAAEFRRDALAAIADVRRGGRVPLLVGGTGLYFRSLFRGLSVLPSADPALRAELERDAEAEGWAALHRRLARLDPVSAERIHPNDAQRIQRALEVCILAGRPMSALYGEGAEAAAPLNFLRIVLCPERSELHERIAVRFRAMLDAGLIGELAGLRQAFPLSPELPAMRVVGYRQTWQYLEGTITRAELEQRGIFATRQLAKRQITWLRGEHAEAWIDGTDRTQEQRLLKTLVDNPMFVGR
jgi:tRNA dimethylallyltransferase